MDQVLGRLREGRDELIGRTTRVADATRRSGVAALGRVRGGAVDWRRTVTARKTALREVEDARWFRLVNLQLAVLDRVDRILSRFSEEMREQMKRLRRLELPAQTSEATAPRAPKKARKANRKSNGKPATKRLVMPIADYEALTAKEILAEVPRLTDAQCKTVFEHERGHRSRKTILKALEARLTT
jgi:hypothetical protein